MQDEIVQIPESELRRLMKAEARVRELEREVERLRGVVKELRQPGRPRRLSGHDLAYMTQLHAEYEIERWEDQCKCFDAETARLTGEAQAAAKKGGV